MIWLTLFLLRVFKAFFSIKQYRFRYGMHSMDNNLSMVQYLEVMFFLSTELMQDQRNFKEHTLQWQSTWQRQMIKRRKKSKSLLCKTLNKAKILYFFWKLSPVSLRETLIPIIHTAGELTRIIWQRWETTHFSHPHSFLGTLFTSLKAQLISHHFFKKDKNASHQHFIPFLSSSPSLFSLF